MTSRRVTVLCLDMAGTTVADDDSVMNAFTAAIASRNLGVAEFRAAMRYARFTMGQSKIEVFRHILGVEEAAQAANAVFEETYGKSVARGELSPIPGAVELFAACREAGIRVCLSTGFSPVTRDAIVAALGWGSLVDLFLSPADAGRGRPWPDMPLTALLRLGGGSVSELAVVGDTPSDIEAGLRAGAGLVAGVLTGASAAADLAAVPAETGLPGEPLILDSVADLAPRLGLSLRLRHEARTRPPGGAMPIPARVAQWNKVGLNRVVRHIAPWMPGLGLVVHRGRRSGRIYRTPINTFPTENGFVIALTYGADNTEWVKNVQAAGGCELRTRGRVLQLDSPNVYHDETRRGIRAPHRQVLRLIGVADFLSLKIVSDASAAESAQRRMTSSPGIPS